MDQSRRAWVWAFLSILAGMAVFSVASPRLWEVEPPRQPDTDFPQAARFPHHPDEVLAKAGPHLLLGKGGADDDGLPPCMGNEAAEEAQSAVPPEGIAVATTSPFPNALSVGEEADKPSLPEAAIIESSSGSYAGMPQPAEQSSQLTPPPQVTQAHSSASIEIDAPSLTPIDDPKPVEPAGKVAAQVTEPAPAETFAKREPATDVPDAFRRLPELLANIPAMIHSAPHEALQTSPDALDPDTTPAHPKMPAAEHKPVQRPADDSWREPEVLLESLKELAGAKPTSHWAMEVTRQVRAMGPAFRERSNEAAEILDRLVKLNGQVGQLAANISDRALAHRLKQTGFALARRLDIWQEVVQLGSPQTADVVVPEVDPAKLAMCLAEIDDFTAGSAEGQSWRRYLLIDALKECSKRQPSSDDVRARQLAQQSLARLTQTPFTPVQQTFISSEPIAALRSELKHWAAEPIGAAAVLRDLERYERTGLPGDAHQLALDCQYLTMAPVEARREMAVRVDTHYRNANLRVAVTEELLNKLIPERKVEYARVDDTVLGHPVRGESVMASEVAVRMLPDPHRVRVALEVTGQITASTTADAGVARIHNDSESSYIARKPIEIDMAGISIWPAEVDVYNDTRLRGVETSLDGVPLFERDRQGSGQIAGRIEQAGGQSGNEAEGRGPRRRSRQHRSPPAVDRSRRSPEPTGFRSSELVVAGSPNG